MRSVPSVPSILLVGCGPHARRIYLHQLALLGHALDVVVDLESCRALVERHCPAATFIAVPDDERDLETLSSPVSASLDAVLTRREAPGDWRAIISTEPKAHLAYLRYFAARGVPALVDKPITAPIDTLNSFTAVERIRGDFDELAHAVDQEPSLIKVQCQRRYHVGYQFIRGLLCDTVAEYGVPVSTMEVYHSDGMWNMPDEFLFRENHPYKYGYGKLFHSGYHFVDLAAWLLEANDALPPERAADEFLLQVSSVTPDDLRAVITDEQFARLFQRGAPSWPADSMHHFGELDLFATAQFRRNARVLTTLSLVLTQTGFSRRAWPSLPPDTYKGNGRVRHERLNIHVGPLLNVQLHSYQAVEIADRDVVDEWSPGGVEHFDIHVFRNTGLIGGPAHETIPLSALTSRQDSEFQGYNEEARMNCLREFLEPGVVGASDLNRHRDSIELTYALYHQLACARLGLPTAPSFAWRRALAPTISPLLGQSLQGDQIRAHRPL